MALTFTPLAHEEEPMWWISPERYCLTRAGKVVLDTDPAAATLLVGKGCRLPLATAQRYGLVKAQAAPPATKAITRKQTK